MNQTDFNKLVEETIAITAKLLVTKGGEYAGSDDRLANFKRGAQLTGCTPLQCAFVYASKHYDAIATAIRDQATGNSRKVSEPITGRLDDLINYCFLIKALFAESKPTYTERDRPSDAALMSAEVMRHPMHAQMFKNSQALACMARNGEFKVLPYKTMSQEQVDKEFYNWLNGLKND